MDLKIIRRIMFITNITKWMSRSFTIVINENDFKHYLAPFMEFMRDSKVEFKKKLC